MKFFASVKTLARGESLGKDFPKRGRLSF